MDFFRNVRVTGTQSTRLDTQTECNVFKHGHMAKQCVVLEHKTDLAFTHMHMRGVFTTKRNRAAVCGF